MRISIFSIPQITLGKYTIKDNRLDEVDNIAKTKKKTYIQVELVGEDSAWEAEAILTLKDSLPDLLLKDLEFVETRLARAEQGAEKVLLDKLKSILENEEFIFNASLSTEEKQIVSGYSLLTNKPVTIAEKKDLTDIDSLLSRVLRESGRVTFFTTTGGKETRAWLIKKGTTAFEAAGVIHSDIQRGFIRAEIMSYADLIQLGGETQVKQAGKLRLEKKDYILQDGDIVNFRFN